MTATDETTTESVDSFRARAAAWIPDHLPRIGAIGRDDPVTRRVDDDGGDPTDPVTRGKALQRIIFDHPKLPKELRRKAERWVQEARPPEWKATQTTAQNFEKAVKRAWVYARSASRVTQGTG